jgi:predicted PurR-regulated permease PerM
MPSRLPWPLVFQVLGVIAAVWLLVSTWRLWLLVFAAVIVGAAMLPAARALERRRIPRGATVLGIYVIAAGVLLLMGRLLWPALSEQGRQFVEHLPGMIENVKDWVGDVRVWIEQWAAWIPTPKTENLGGVFGGMFGGVIGGTFAVTAGVVGAVVGFLAILVIAAYFVVDAEHIGRGVMRLVPPARRDTFAALGEPLVARVGAYVRGQLAVSVCVGVMLAVALSLLGVRYALLIGALAAVLNIVPWIGSFVASVLGILSASNDSFGLAVATAAVFAASNFVEAKLLVPQLVGRATGLHPLAVMLALLAGAQLAGLIGALVAVPLVAALWEIVEALYIAEHRLRAAPAPPADAAAG